MRRKTRAEGNRTMKAAIKLAARTVAIGLDTSVREIASITCRQRKL